MHISGTNVEGKSNIKEGYFLSRCFNVWGWATWRRAWKFYDVTMSNYPKNRFDIFKKTRRQGLISQLRSIRLYELAFRSKVDTWDYQWDYICKLNSGLCIIPKNNLITNLGFDNLATHTAGQEKIRSLKRFEIGFPIIPKEEITVSEEYDDAYTRFFKKGTLKRLFNSFKN
jgi:hypothetical protein